MKTNSMLRNIELGKLMDELSVPQLVLPMSHDQADEIGLDIGSDSVQEIHNAFFSLYRDAIISWVDTHFGIDSVSFEGGINEWFGPGSIAIHELGLTFSLTFQESGFTLIIE